MRTPILVILLTLAWVPWGEAGAKTIEIHPACLVYENKILNAPCESGGGLAAIGALPCLAKMREAMEAMEPFVGPVIRFQFNGQERWINRKLEDGKDIKDVFEAQDQWNATKKDCWAQP